MVLCISFLAAQGGLAVKGWLIERFDSVRSRREDLFPSFVPHIVSREHMFASCFGSMWPYWVRASYQVPLCPFKPRGVCRNLYTLELDFPSGFDWHPQGRKRRKISRRAAKRGTHEVKHPCHAVG